METFCEIFLISCDQDEANSDDDDDGAPGLPLASEGFWAELRGRTPGTQGSFRCPYHYLSSSSIHQAKSTDGEGPGWLEI